MKTIFKIIFDDKNILMVFILFIIQTVNMCWNIFSPNFGLLYTLFAILSELFILAILIVMIIDTYNYQKKNKSIMINL